MIIELTQEEYDRAAAHGEAVYERHRNAGHHHKVSAAGLNMKRLAVLGKAGEVAFQKVWGGVLDWDTTRSDRGFDLEHEGVRHAIRTRSNGYRDLIIQPKLNVATDYIHVLMEQEPRFYEYIGWITYDGWTQKRVIEDFGHGDSWYVMERDLEPSLEKLRSIIAEDRWV